MNAFTQTASPAGAAPSESNIVQFPKAVATISDLPFVRSKGRGKGYSYWSVKSSGTYQDDWLMGAQYADAYLQLLEQNPCAGNTSLLACIVFEMKDNDAKGIACGFMRHIALVQMIGSRAAALEYAKHRQEWWDNFVAEQRAERSQRARHAAVCRWSKARR